MKKKSTPITNIGTVSLLMIFIILCLVVFAVLSLSSSTRDHTLSKRVAIQNTAYYTASNDATYKLKEIDDTFLELNEAADDYNEILLSRLSDIKDITIQNENSEIIISYSREISSDRELQVVLIVNSPSKYSEGFYKINKWKSVSTKEWTNDETMNLM
ncbi:MAG: hypothetical protein ACK5LL_03160 [Suipraeoptans sp.]